MSEKNEFPSEKINDSTEEISDSTEKIGSDTEKIEVNTEKIPEIIPEKTRYRGQRDTEGKEVLIKHQEELIQNLWEI